MTATQNQQKKKKKKNEHGMHEYHPGCGAQAQDPQRKKPNSVQRTLLEEFRRPQGHYASYVRFPPKSQTNFHTDLGLPAE